MNRFNIEHHKNHEAFVICRSKEEAEEFCRYLNSNGREWASGTSYLETAHWNDAVESGYNIIAYCFNFGTYTCDKRYLIGRQYVYEFSDFDWDDIDYDIGSFEDIL